MAVIGQIKLSIKFFNVQPAIKLLRHCPSEKKTNMSNPFAPFHNKLFFFKGNILQHCLKEIGAGKSSFYPFEISKMSESPFKNSCNFDLYKMSTFSKQLSPV